MKRLRSFRTTSHWLVILTVLLCSASILAANASVSQQTVAPQSTMVQRNLSNMPLAFTKNTGQWTDSILFSDDFESGLNAAWRISGTCAWETSNKVARTVTSGYQQRCYLEVGDGSWTDYTLDVDVRSDAGNDRVIGFRQFVSGGYGINLRSAPINDIHLDGPDESFTKTLSNQNGQWYHITIQCVGARLRVFVDGVQMFDYTDLTNPVLSGGIYLAAYAGAGQCDISYDNVRVTKFTVQNPECPLLSVSPYYQTSPPWADDIYDHAGSSWKPKNKTIARWGCAMTCMAMTVKFHGVSQGADGLPVDPGHLNSWLKTHNGYDKSGNIRWPAIEPYTGHKVKFVGATPTRSENLLIGDLKTSKPVTLRLGAYGGHYVLATGKSDCSHYNIIDPLSSTKVSLASYSNQWLSLRRFQENPVNLRILNSPSVLLAAYKDIAIMVTDSLGRRTGYDVTLDSIIEEIPNAYFYKDVLEPDSTEIDSAIISDSVPNPVTTSIYVENPISGNLRITFYPTDSTECNYEVLRYTSAADTPFVSSYNASAPIGDSAVINLHLGSTCCIGHTGNVDCDPTDRVDISDLTALIDYLYISFTPLCCKTEANVDGSADGNTDISDLSALIDYLYISFTPPALCQ